MRCLIQFSSMLIILANGAQTAEIYWTEPPDEVLFAPFPYRSMELVTLQDPEFDFSDYRVLHVQGDIEPGDQHRLEALLREELPDPNVSWFNTVLVSFNSGGGDFFTGLAMSDIIQGMAVGTYVGADSQCLSSCAIAFLGGSEIPLRNFPPVARRYIHTEGILGFHAPFSSLRNTIQISDGTVLTPQVVNFMATQFYGQAQGAINELARRMAAWDVSPDFVFSMLTRKEIENDERSLDDRFIIVDSYIEAEQISATPLAPYHEPLTEIGLMDAYAACSFVWHFNSPGFVTVSGLAMETAAYVNDALVAEGELSIDENHVRSYGAIPVSGMSEPVVAVEQHGTYSYRRLVPASGPDSFYIEGLAQGRGPTQCNVYRAPDGNWMVRTFNEDVHFDATQSPVPGTSPGDNRYEILDFNRGYPISTYTRLGADGSWRSLDETGLFAMYGGPTDGYPDVSGPSFGCAGDLDPAAEIICAYPTLAREDGIMGKLYGPAREIGGDVVRNGQRHWVSVRNRACRPAAINHDDPFSRARLAECLFYFTRMRVSELQEILN
ncbi:hypothetical protein [Thalassorhabdomicrobium marinisediminis]|uniref:Uncharacterized protein n=1 Tax=Thalassorhabdomicrobium marinisediminis TaxID=2170577 RepID=A0A2T7FY54_9RHOB|nr:hypothetical protein [Thalassorhabdomicrobium marinisediminis]PVA07094.1 hypothetical protein DC363_08135 [Thalassorhabdomicrobium marinisediminis]